MLSRNINAARKAGGEWLKQKRLDAGLTQRELARLTDLDYYTFISQIEAGKGRVPPERYAEFARALKMDVREFAWQQLRFYEPEIYQILHSGKMTK